MNEQYHVTTTYSPLTGKFYAGDKSSLDMKVADSYLKPIASLVANGEKPLQLVSSGRVGLMANTIKTQPMLAAADPVNLSHLQQIQLIRKTIGEPAKYFALDELYSTLTVDMLQARESIQGTFTNEGYLAPLEETLANEAKYTEIEYNLKKLTFLVYTPIEDIMRTIINPQTITHNTAKWDLERRRNDQAAIQLAKITNNTDVGIIDSLAQGAFHSDNKTASRIADVINDHLEANQSILTHIGMNNSDFAKYTENTWTNSGPTNMQFDRIVGAGVVPFPGVSGLTAVIDPKIPKGIAYLIDKINGSRLAEGPKIMRRFFDEGRDAEAIKVSDFNQYKIVIPDQDEVPRQFSKLISFK